MPNSKRVILMLDISRGSDRSVVNGIVEYAHLRGNWTFDFVGPLFRSHTFSSGEHEDLVTRLKRLDADGLIGYLPDDTVLRQTIVSSAFPAVVIPIDQPIAGLINIGQDARVGELGAEHFLDRGYSNLAFCGTLDHWSRIRRQGFETRVLDANKDVFTYKSEADRDLCKEIRTLNMAQWLMQLPKPVGIMCSNDELGREVAAVCHEFNLKIPEHVGILGVDNDEMICRIASPALSSIKMNSYQVGYACADILNRLIQRESIDFEPPVFHAIGLETRHSTDMLAIDDEEVAIAINFIRNHARKAICVQDVVSETTLSTRALQQRFKFVTGKTIHQEIRRVRTEQLKHMLIHTNQSVHSIGKDLDFRDVDHISRLFRRETGMSPMEFRKRFSPC